jgi:hypothetical protein
MNRTDERLGAIVDSIGERRDGRFAERRIVGLLGVRFRRAGSEGNADGSFAASA